MARRCFYSFHYKGDCHRASLVRNIGAIEGNKPAADNDWEAVKLGGDAEIERWIVNQMQGRSCTIVLVGAQTANRKWINHEIVQSWNNLMGVFGIYIHGLKNLDGVTTNRGGNPFSYITHGASGRVLSSIVKCYDPIGVNSKERYAWISENIVHMVEEAIDIRNQFDY